MEMRHEILETSRWFDEDDEGILPARVALIWWVKEDGTTHEFSTHLQVRNEDGHLSLTQGNYFPGIVAAVKDYEGRKDFQERAEGKPCLCLVKG